MDQVQMLIIFYYIVIKGMLLNEGLSHLDNLFQNFQMWYSNLLKKIVVETLNDACFLFWIPYIMDKKHAGLYADYFLLHCYKGNGTKWRFITFGSSISKF